MRKSFIRRICAGFMAALLLCVTCLLTPLEPLHARAAGEMRNMTTMELVQDMGIGINLGNTLESYGDWIDQWGDGTPNAYETAWGSPTITEAMIQGYANAGFGTLRIPVAWSNLMADDGTYTISSAYLARVQEVANWALDAGMYVIVNIHYDGGWFSNFSTDKDTSMTKYRRIWEQLSAAFTDYSDYLILESLNEEGAWDDIWNRWSGTDSQKQEAYSLLNEINQTFVDIVRSSGGNNAERHLLIAGYATDVTLTCDPYFQMPSDPAGRCAVSVHYYTPSDFAILEEDADWGTARSTWGTDADLQELDTNMNLLQATFIEDGIPVIIGEYGCPKNNKDETSVRLFLTSVCEAARARQICPVLWDIQGLHYDRETCAMTDTQLQQSLLSIRDAYAPDDIAVSGDLSGDDVFDLADCVLLQQYLLGLQTITEAQIDVGDLSGDGILNNFDLTCMKQSLLAE